MEKMTNAMRLEELKGIVANINLEPEVAADLTEFLDKELDKLARKAEKSRERAHEKRVAGDALRAKIEAVLTADYVTAEAVLEKIEDEPELTKAKVVSRLGALVRANVATKELLKDEASGKKVMHYALITDSPIEE